MDDHNDNFEYNPYPDDFYEYDEHREKIEVDIKQLAMLFRGVIEGNTIVVLKILNDNPALASCADVHDRTFLMYAAYAGSNSILKVFLDNDLIPPTVIDDNGFTAFDWAVLGNNPIGSRMIAAWLRKNQPLD